MTEPQTSEKKRKVIKYHRVRPHRNPLSDYDAPYPIAPQFVDWTTHYPTMKENPEKKVEFLDIGCGYGGLTVGLATLFPENVTLAIEIRGSVQEYVRLRIDKLREENAGQYQNVSVLQTNAMKFLTNYFEKGQIKKVFFLFPDPHFKKANYRRRIITSTLLADYAYVMAEGALIYTVTDVLDLHEWMDGHLAKHPLFEKVSEEELVRRLCFPSVAL
eukprot:TRINITY_DN5708_c0_g1_i1.p1 TRINITY_DN5708_c0_g1~~TRINITY_DN5708_c0_g1_i1.p1  ORF type:complete len:216 (-),score=57.17 TRINITY_DN5708_c0_g1_i1:76-723(-)